MADEGEMTLVEIGRALGRIEQKVDKTNGRVTAIELWRARVQGAWFVMSFAGPILTALLIKYVS
jgi:hypothetical protein